MSDSPYKFVGGLADGAMRAADDRQSSTVVAQSWPRVESGPARLAQPLVILGAPATKKTSQKIVRNRKTGKPIIVPSDITRSWSNTAILQLRSQYRRPPLTVQVAIKATFYRARNTGDLLNFEQAWPTCSRGSWW